VYQHHIGTRRSTGHRLQEAGGRTLRVDIAQRQAAGISQGMVRVAAGLEDLEDLKADLARGLDTLAR
jgi:cystathionine beta-lyase/cystathionine gamma-synthase